MEIVELTKDQYIDSIRLSMYAFQYDVPDEKMEERKKNISNHKIFGIYDQDTLAAKLHIIPFRLWLQGKKWDMGGIAGVATYPEYRRKGHVRKLIMHSLKVMKEQKQTISMLHPFSIPFYRKFGWELFVDRKKIHLLKADLIFMPRQEGFIKRLKKESHTDYIEDIYESFASQFSGMLNRDRDWWMNNVYGNEQIAVYFNEQKKAEGYLLYSVVKSHMKVEEFVSLSPASRAGLWNFICQHDSMVNSVEIEISQHEPLSFMMPNPRVKMELHPYFMCRIVDVKDFLEKYEWNWGDEEELFLHINDPLAEWNDQSFIVTRKGVQSIAKTENTKGIRMQINALSTMCFGYKNPMELWELGAIHCSRDEAVRLNNMLKVDRPFLYDFF
ncbi:GNAT family N-acetyltransferase [Falsibacillus albus]|uniref:GNAT family N-acetyltransferase n=1 Tax=Falsibacillus albus TaxID=2478915 RepID=A0A3L7JZW7_9BACI|nr:GNAT family N-acetyltransferase [Falsibacillus albus]RLQ95865.1 GNAT family N-acetyltransferase [Falsibacillus albus]